MADTIEKLKLVYFMLGLMLATAVYANLLVLATPSDGIGHNSEGLTELSSGHMKTVRKVPVLAVDDKGYRGDVAVMTVQGVPGNSDTYIRTSPYIEPALQHSSNIAVQVAKGYMNDDNEMDFIITYDISNGHLGGESAGAAKTIAMIALYQGKELKDNVVITGTIYPNGRIGYVEEIPKKIKAAAEHGFDKILIPEELHETTFSDRFTIQRTSRYSEMDDIQHYAKSEHDIEVVNVNNIDEAIDHMLL
ncbi:MAG: S16 family serine protease [Candidatus Woesearchaeota archaeon]